MKNNETQPVSIDITVLTEQVNKGMKKAELAEFYGIPVTQMTSALKQAGLKIRKFHHPKFVLVNNTVGDTVGGVANAVKEEDSKKDDVIVGDLFSQSEEVQEEPVVTQEAEETTSNSVSWED